MYAVILSPTAVLLENWNFMDLFLQADHLALHVPSLGRRNVDLFLALDYHNTAVPLHSHSTDHLVMRYR